MWTRAQIKTDAKVFLKKHFWKAFMVCLLPALLGVGLVFSNTANEVNDVAIQIQNSIDTGDLSLVFSLLGGSVVSIILVILTYLLNVGMARFFIEGYKDNTEIDVFFSVFNKNEWWEIIKTQFMVDLYVFLWSLLLFIPGIIKSLEYYFVPYILAENPKVPTKKAIAMSRKITYGHKMDIFVLSFSFILWDLVGILTLGIGSFFVAPYKKATEARLYNILSDISTIEDMQ